MGIQFRLAEKEDCELLYKWVNDPVVRQNSFNSNPIKYEDHKNWFYKKIRAEKCIFLIVLVNDEPIGQIRLDIKGDVAIVNYSVDEQYRGRGYGTQILINIPKIIKKYNLHVNKVIGKVKLSNFASQKAFEKAGYERKKFSDYIKYSKNI